MHLITVVLTVFQKIMMIMKNMDNGSKKVLIKNFMTNIAFIAKVKIQDVYVTNLYVDIFTVK